MFLRSGVSVRPDNSQQVEKTSAKKRRFSKRTNYQESFIGSGHHLDLGLSAKLPLNLLVLKRYLFLRNENAGITGLTISTKETFKIILKELQIVWGRAHIPMKQEIVCMNQLLRLFNQWDLLKKKGINASKKKKDEFQQKMQCLCDLSAPDSYKQLKNSRSESWEEDWNFLLNQRKVPQV